MQVTSMLSAGYLEPMQNVSRVQAVNKAKEVDESKQVKEQEILAEEQSLRAKLGNDAQVHVVYHYSMGSDGKNYITGASVTMKGSEEDLSKVSGGVLTEDLQAQKKEKEAEDSQNIIKSEAKKREAKKKDDKAEIQEDEQVRELKNIQNEVIAHEQAHKAAAGEFGGGISYSYTEGPDGKRYITGGEVPIKLKQGSTPEETLRNMQKVQAAANAPADPSGQDRQVAAKAAAIASRARSEIAREKSAENNDERKTTVAKGTPIINSVSREDEQLDPDKNGVASVLAAVKELQLQNIIPAA